MTKRAFEELELRHDFMFGKVMSNKELCRRTLEVLLGIAIDDISYPRSQETIDIISNGKGVRLDVYVEDDNSAVYDAEMQRSFGNTDNELSLRSRYYQGMIDLNLMEKGARYQDLNESYVIFICTFDPFGKGRYCYTFRSICEEDSQVYLRDRTTKVFLNTKGTTGEISEELKAFLSYVETAKAASELTAALDAEVKRVRKSEEWRVEYMKTVLHDLEMKWEGREEGRQEGKQVFLISQMQKKLLKGKPLETIAEELEETPESIEPLYQLLKQYPDESPEAICERLQMR